MGRDMLPYLADCGYDPGRLWHREWTYSTAGSRQRMSEITFELTEGALDDGFSVTTVAHGIRIEGAIDVIRGNGREAIDCYFDEGMERPWTSRLRHPRAPRKPTALRLPLAFQILHPVVSSCRTLPDFFPSIESIDRAISLPTFYRRIQTPPVPTVTTVDGPRFSRSTPVRRCLSPRSPAPTSPRS